MINIQFVFGFIGAAIGLIIGIMVFGQIAVAINCPGEVGSVNSLGVTITADNKDKYQIIASKTTSPGTADAVGKFTTTKHTAAATGSANQTTEYTMSAPELNPGNKECTSAKSTAWTVMGILPITLFFVLFSIFGAFGRQE